MLTIFYLHLFPPPSSSLETLTGVNTVIAHIYKDTRIKVIQNPWVFVEYQETTPIHTPIYCMCTLTPVRIHLQITFILSELLKNGWFMKSSTRERGHAKIGVFWRLDATPCDMLLWMPSPADALSYRINYVVQLPLVSMVPQYLS